MLWKRPFFFRGLEVYSYELKLLILWDGASIHLAAANASALLVLPAASNASIAAP
jgi:hypothetical protein